MVFVLILFSCFLMGVAIMSKNPPPVTYTIPPEVRDLLGPAPLLRTEDPARYERILAMFAQCVRPQNFVEWLFVRDLADERWEIERLRGLKPLLVEQAYQSHLTQTKAAIKHAFGTEVAALSLTARAGALWDQKLDPAVKSERDGKLKADVDNLASKTQSKIDLLDKSPDNADFARVVQDWLSPYERLEKLQRGAEDRFTRGLEELEHYRAGLGQLLPKAADQIIDGEFCEVASPVIANEVPSSAPPSAPFESPPSHSKDSASADQALRNGEVAAPKDNPISLAVPAAVPLRQHNSVKMDKEARFERPDGRAADATAVLEVE